MIDLGFCVGCFTYKYFVLTVNQKDEKHVLIVFNLKNLFYDSSFPDDDVN